jgi:hypothetical protein
MMNFHILVSNFSAWNFSQDLGQIDARQCAHGRWYLANESRDIGCCAIVASNENNFLRFGEWSGNFSGNLAREREKLMEQSCDLC